MLLIDKKIGHILPSRFVGFLLVGGSGVAVNLAVLAVLFRLLAVEFVIAQSVAIVVSMTTNFLLNNFLTYRDRRLTGWSVLRGWMTFVAACSLGGIANVGVASWMYDGSFNWMLSALAGILFGTVWNYATTAVFTWGASRK